MPARAKTTRRTAQEGGHMAESDNPQTDPQEGPHGTDWKAESRKWEERSKANRAELDALKAQLDE